MNYAELVVDTVSERCLNITEFFLKKKIKSLCELAAALWGALAHSLRNEGLVYLI